MSAEKLVMENFKMWAYIPYPALVSLCLNEPIGIISLMKMYNFVTGIILRLLAVQNFEVVC